MTYAELRSVGELLAMLITDWRPATLIVLIAIAAISDYKSHRIPNWLVLTGLVLALVYSIIIPMSPNDGALWALEGMITGFVLLVVFWLMGIMGAGDVKLMAMIGAFLGPMAALYSVLFSMAAGGVLAIGYAAARRSTGRMFRNITNTVQLGFMSVIGGIKPTAQLDPGVSVGRMPFGIAIAVGTISYLVLNQLGFL
jgi:prepilin peptidase CpaA